MIEDLGLAVRRLYCLTRFVLLAFTASGFDTFDK